MRACLSACVSVRVRVCLSDRYTNPQFWSDRPQIWCEVSLGSRAVQRQVGDHVTHCVLTQIASIYAKLALGKEANFQLATTAVFLDRFPSNLV